MGSLNKKWTSLEKVWTIKEAEKNLDELEKSLLSLKKYYDYDDVEYRGLRDTENLFNRTALNKIFKNYYKLKKTKRAFNGNYIEYESKGDKKKKLSPKEYLNIIRPYLSEQV